MAVKREMKRGTELQETNRKPESKPAIGGWTGWLLGRLARTGRHEPRLQLLERITLAPRQSLALVEADGRRLLVATSADGGPAFYALDGCTAGAARGSVRENSNRSARVSW
ncbi:MAG: flagellar biosynthetic protein FliO [Terracidiphilus sp.]